jgi:hypothetical protein
MASELKVNGVTTGSTVYAVIENEGGLLWNGTTFETFSAANWATYKVALTEQAGTGRFRANFPTAIKTPGVYDIQYRIQTGGSPVVADTNISSFKLEWDGAQVNSLTDVDAILASDDKTYVVRVSAFNTSGEPVEDVALTFTKAGSVAYSGSTGRDGQYKEAVVEGTYVLAADAPAAYADPANQTVVVNGDKGVSIILETA